MWFGSFASVSMEEPPSAYLQQPKCWTRYRRHLSSSGDSNSPSVQRQLGGDSVSRTVLGARTIQWRGHSPSFIVTDLLTGRSFEQCCDGWKPAASTGSVDNGISCILASSSLAEGKIIAYEGVTIVTDNSRWVQTYPAVPHLTSKTIPMNGTSTRDYKGSYRLWKPAGLIWNTHPRYPITASRWKEKANPKHLWGIDQQYTLDIESFFLIKCTTTQQ